jgi:WD40 repeat protein
LIEAHDGPLRGLALTANGSKFATTSTKGTVIRVFDVATTTCLQEFRRGVERATITCLCWSWDYAWLACTSDKGTAHVFWVGADTTNDDSTMASPSSKSKKKSMVTGLFSSVKKTVVNTASGGGESKKKSVCQIRGVPHPLACAFCSDAKNVLAVAGWDADGNGVLLLSEFAANQETRRVAYHVLTKSSLLDLDGTHRRGGEDDNGGGLDDRAATGEGESEEERRRRRLRGWTPSEPQPNKEAFVITFARP